VLRGEHESGLQSVRARLRVRSSSKSQAGVKAVNRELLQDQPRRPAVPVAIVGGALSADCAPRDANYNLFYDASAAPAWKVRRCELPA